jgi:hypothetical protein
LLVIGSHALKDITGAAELGRTPRDLDVIGTWEELLDYQTHARIAYPVSGKKWFIRFNPNAWNPSGIVEFEIAWPGSPEEKLIKYGEALPNSEWSVMTSASPAANAFIKVANKDILYTLKMSHRYLKDSPHFQKTRGDIILLRRYGAQIWNQKWFDAREKETYAYSHPKLSQRKQNFFADDGIDYLYDHDQLHEIVKVGKTPAYTKYQTDGEEVLSDHKKFLQLDHVTQLSGVYEEAAVLALERSVIPHSGEPRKAFLMALEKVCTSITSGWFREFAWENYDQVLHLLDSIGDDWYYRKFKEAVAEGELQPQK